jgi:hypothetical protein
MWLDYSSRRFERSYRLHFQGLAVLVLIKKSGGQMVYLKIETSRSFKTSETRILTKLFNISEDLNINL